MGSQSVEEVSKGAGVLLLSLCPGQLGMFPYENPPHIFMDFAVQACQMPAASLTCLLSKKFTILKEEERKESQL